jgi:hypothetical protein
MDRKDPSTIFSYLALLALLVSMLPWYVTANGALKWATGLWLLLPIVAAPFLGALNWIIATNWIVALSQLTVEKEKADHLNNWNKLFNLLKGRQAQQEEEQTPQEAESKIRE